MSYRIVDGQPIFVGLKMDSTVRRMLSSLEGPDRRYVSAEDPSFLVTCRRGEDRYVGKVVVEALSTARVDDVRRNVLSILRRVCPEVRFPDVLDVFPCEREDVGRLGDAPDARLVDRAGDD